MDNAAYTWEFGTGCAVRIFKEGKANAVVIAEYDDKFRFKMFYSSCDIDWNRAVACLAEAKSVLKKIKKI